MTRETPLFPMSNPTLNVRTEALQDPAGAQYSPP